MKPDITARVQLYKTEHGGRREATPTDKFSCVIRIAGRQHDCRFILENIGSLIPGMLVDEVPVKFLNPKAALFGVSEGDEFIMLENGGAIGKGTIVHIEV